MTAPACPAHAAGGLSRRGLFRSAAATSVITTIGSAVITTQSAGAATAAAAPASSVIVVLSLRGGVDGLSLVVPHGDPLYYLARPTIAIPKSALVAPDSFFGLHPAMSSLLPLWRAGSLAAVHATGLPIANRSHFAAMEELEDAAPGSDLRVGWLNRLLAGVSGSSPIQGMSIGSPMPPTSLLGPEPVLPVRDLAHLRVAGSEPEVDRTGARVRSLNAMWRSSGRDLGAGVRGALDGSADLLPVLQQQDRSASYPDSDLGRALSSVARTIRADRGVSVITVDQGAWDMHTDVGTASTGQMVYKTRNLAESMAAFFADLGPMADRVTLVTISEFGRRIAENANRGLDHGWGNVMLLAGAGVKGGRYYGRWPTLLTLPDADLTVTTDYRSVLAEVVATRTSASVAQVFPGFQPETVGVMTRL